MARTKCISDGVILDLSFLYDPEHFSWIERHCLNCRCKKMVKRAAAEGRVLPVASEQVAEQLHRYYRVPKDRIEVLAKA